ncbi:MAG: hypothetical protein AAF629_11240 [Chloroflexota bacterium]
MICPHCKANILHRERTGRRCGRCKEKFALEPKSSPLRIHDMRIHRVTAKLSSEGAFVYTPRQLYYALIRRDTDALKRFFKTSLGCLFPAIFLSGFVACSGILDVFGSPLNAGIIMATLAICIWGILLLWQWSHPSRRFKPPITLKKFDSHILKPWHQLYGQYPAHMLTNTKTTFNQVDQTLLDQLKAVVLCTDQELYQCLLANTQKLDWGIGVLPLTQNPNPPQQALIETLRRQPKIPLLLLHNADVTGALLIHRVRRGLKLSAEHIVLDLGLHPHQVWEHNLLTLGASPTRAQLAELAKYVVKDAPDNRSDQLSTKAYTWLKEGHYGPILGLTPRRIFKMIRKAIDRVPNREPSAEEQAQGIGFMTWPQSN